MSATNIMTPSDLMSPYTATHADPPRISMQVQQSRHTMPTVKQSKPLFGSGVERVIPYNISSDFVDIAKEDGIVKSVDEKTQLAILEYKDGTTECIDFSERVSKNGSNGFYISNKKDLIFKEGQRFKKGDIVSKNSDFFLGDKQGEISYTEGYLAKVAMFSGDFTMEDSSLITEEVGESLASYVTMMIPVQLGPNTNILNMVKKGQHIKTGDSLITFEHSFDESDANRLLDTLSDELTDFVNESNSMSKKSKFPGEIVDIRIYYNVEEEVCSPSLQNIIKNYKLDVNKKRKIIDGTSESSIILPTVEKINNTKIKGKEMEGILIEFYVRHLDIMGIGDKVVYGTAIKTIIADVVPKGEEPYSERNKDEHIDAIFSPLSVVSRLTTDMYNMLYTNKLIIELKKQVTDIWNE